MKYVLYLLLLFLAVGWDFCVHDFIFMCEKMIYQLKRKYYKTVRTYVGLISWDHLGAWDQSGPHPSQTVEGEANVSSTSLVPFPFLLLDAFYPGIWFLLFSSYFSRSLTMDVFHSMGRKCWASHASISTHY